MIIIYSPTVPGISTRQDICLLRQLKRKEKSKDLAHNMYCFKVAYGGVLKDIIWCFREGKAFSRYTDTIKDCMINWLTVQVCRM